MSCCDKSQNQSTLTLETKIGVGVTSTIARSDGGKWRFFISSDRMVKVKIKQDSPLSNLPAKIQYIAPNSGIEIQGSNSVVLECENLDPSNLATVQTWNADYLTGGLEPVQYAEQQLTADNATFTNMGSFGGYPAPFCNRARLYVDQAATTRIQARDYLNNLVFASGYQPVDERVYIDLHTPQAYRWEINKTSAGTVNYAVVWYRD